MSFSGKTKLFGSSEDGKESEFLKEKLLNSPSEYHSSSSEKFQFFSNVKVGTIRSTVLTDLLDIFIGCK